MKKILFLLLVTLCTLTLWSCGESEDPHAPKVEVKLRNTSIKEGAEVNAQYTKSVVLTYNVDVMVSPTANITLNGKKAEARTRANSTKEIEVSLSLEPATTYTLSVPKGSILFRKDEKWMAEDFTLSFKTGAPVPEAEENPISLTGKAITMAREMGWGWNLGNHFDTGANTDADGKPIDFQKPQWGYWDGAKPTETLYQNLAKMGVKTVRIPVTWGVWQANDGQYTISPDYMAEVEQNVTWALNAGLYVVLNTHHDEYWQDIIGAVGNSNVNATIEDRLTKTWTQIANHFRDFDYHLIFETMNEVHDDSWGWKSGYNYRPVYTMMNEWNKVCVDAIRSTGGRNVTRWIGIPGLCANPVFTYDNLTIPNDDPRIMVAVHSYDPYNFCTEGSVQQWGHTFRNNDSDEQQVIDLFQKLNSKYIARNIPCYLGEYGAVRRKDAADEKYRKYYLEYFTRCAYLNHIPMMLWDNNNNDSSGEVFYFINHNDGTLHDQELVTMMINAGSSTDSGYTLQNIHDSAE